MAKRRPGRPKGSKNKGAKGKGLASFISPKLSEKVLREASGVVLFILALIILLGFMGVGGSLSIATASFLKIYFGWATFILTITLMVFSVALFFPEKLELTPYTYIGLAGFVLTFAGMFHIHMNPEDSLYWAERSSGGGLIGYQIQKIMLTFFNSWLSLFILIGLSAVFFLIASNTSLRDILASLKREGDEIKEKAKDKKKDIKINEPEGSEKIKKIKDTKKEEEDHPPMVVGSDTSWKFPPLELLEVTTTKPDAGNIKKNADIIAKTLENFSVKVAMGDVNVGPTVTQYTLKPDEGVKLNKITNLDRDLALSLAAHPVRIEAPIPGKSLVGVEIPNKEAAIVRLRSVMESETFEKRRSNLSVVLGLDVAGHPQIADITKMPHLLIAGATGSGKSVCINAILLSLLYQNTPKQLKMILVDPKRVELSLYNGVPHLLTPVVVEPEKTVSALKWAVVEMEKRYKTLQDAGKRNINEYNAAKGQEGLPYIVIVIDELADLMAVSASEVEHLIVRLSQMARAVGIHLVLATQRPSVNVITGLIKANVTTRVAFSVASQVDSRTILDQSGAEKLLGMGDMLFISADTPKPKRIQGAFVAEKEVKGVTDFLKNQGEPEYNEEILAQPTKAAGDLGAPDDDLFIDAADVVVRSGKASASLLQRRLRIGYARAARLLDLLEERAIIGPPDGSRPRDVLISDISEILDESQDEE
ncbi:MAG: DNA translocase FtsK 4TM domain-containing protein [Patescibacteria group bacterium]|nr:DNA translocase FtsK 4TM domain-containing protein [Patescibacteria group bacterium]